MLNPTAFRRDFRTELLRARSKACASAMTPFGPVLAS